MGGYDDALVRGWLAFVGRPSDAATLAKTLAGGLAASDAERASVAGLSPVWCHHNDPVREAAKGKAAIGDIATINNLVVDLDAASDPEAAHAAAVESRWRLAERWLCRPDHPIVRSGGGAHLVFPITPVGVADLGGAAIADAAVKYAIGQHIAPIVRAAIADLGVADRVKLDTQCFEISRVLSVAGTWRPGKAGDHPSIAGGTMRRWLDVYDAGTPPLRSDHTSSHLAYIVRGAARCYLSGEWALPPDVVIDESGTVVKRAASGGRAEALALYPVAGIGDLSEAEEDKILRKLPPKVERLAGAGRAAGAHRRKGAIALAHLLIATVRDRDLILKALVVYCRRCQPPREDGIAAEALLVAESGGSIYDPALAMKWYGRRFRQ